MRALWFEVNDGPRLVWVLSESIREADMSWLVVFSSHCCSLW